MPTAPRRRNIHRRKSMIWGGGAIVRKMDDGKWMLGIGIHTDHCSVAGGTCHESSPISYRFAPHRGRFKPLMLPLVILADVHRGFHHLKFGGGGNGVINMKLYSRKKKWGVLVEFSLPIFFASKFVRRKSSPPPILQ